MTVETDQDADLDTALAYHSAGATDQAEPIYRKILSQAPDDVEALNLLGLLLQDRGGQDEAIALLTRAVELDPEFPEALTNLARVQLATGDSAAALLSARRAAELDPELPEAHLQLGRALLQKGDAAEAETALRKAVSLAPAMVEAHTVLAVSQVQSNRPDDALESIAAALRLQPNQSPALITLGSILASLNRLDEALECYQHAVALAPDNVAAHEALARTHLLNLDPAGSAESCRRAVVLDPSRGDLWLLLGANLAALGEFDEAERCQKHALALNPQSAEAWRDLTIIARQEGAAGQLRAILGNPRTSEPDRIAAGFGLGAELDRQKDFEGAFAAYRAANDLLNNRNHREGRGLDVTAFRLTIDWLIATFNKAFFSSNALMGDPSERPVFIVGMPRSGTSLVEQILASHKAVFGAGERKDIGDIVRQLDGGLVSRVPADWPASAGSAYRGGLHREDYGAVGNGRALPRQAARQCPAAGTYRRAVSQRACHLLRPRSSRCLPVSLFSAVRRWDGLDQ